MSCSNLDNGFCWPEGFGVENNGPESLCCPITPPAKCDMSLVCCVDESKGPLWTGEMLAEVGLLPFLGGGGGGTFFCLLPESELVWGSASGDLFSGTWRGMPRVGELREELALFSAG